MRRALLEALAPVCPACRAAGRPAAAVRLHEVVREEPGRVIEGALVCGDARCQAEFPIIDEVPYLVADVAGTLSAQLETLLARRDLAQRTMSLLGDAAGPDSAFERARQQVSSYGRSHYGDLDPDDRLPADAAFVGVVQAALDVLGPPQVADATTGAGQPLIDLGCGPGRSTMALAAATGRDVLGVDLNVGMLGVALGARRGRVRHPLRRVGLAYDQRDFPAVIPGAERVDFWAADVQALPFLDGTFGGALSLNVLDCVGSPLLHLSEMGRVLSVGARVVIGSPFDWSTAATTPAAWIGGHSDRGPGRGASEEELRRLLASGDPAEAGTGLVADADAAEHVWEVYVHQRASMRYRVHLLGATRS